MKASEKEIREALKSVGVNADEDFTFKTAKLATDMLETGVVPKEALGFSDEKVEAIYGQAYRLYNSGKYEEASQIFRLLMVLDSTDSKYMLGLAACLHMMKQYKNAVKVYTIAAILDGNNPIPHFHLSDCFIQMNDQVSAIMALEMAIKRAGDKQEYQILKDRALLTIESLKKELEKEE